MHSRLAGILSLITLILTALWLILVIVGMSLAPSPATLAEAVEYA